MVVYTSIERLSSHPVSNQSWAGNSGYSWCWFEFSEVHCGTQDIHRALEQKLTKFHGREDAILYAACFDATGGFFEETKKY
uniref:Uncharacterized protein n=1 Tax=Onchocerca volvulus TaxID=6282 RepID=A0A8R1XZH8_ONCVO